VNYWDEQMGAVMDEAMGTPFDLVLGRRTYDIFAAHWPRVPDEEGGKPLNDATKYVASRGEPSLEWSRSVHLKGDVAEGIAALKQEDGPELQVHGSGNLVRWLLDNQLVDEITLLTYPVIVGQGTRLFPDIGPDTALELVDSHATPKGVTIHVYRPTGRPQYAAATPD
jgi:dihydrofolate reductase